MQLFKSAPGSYQNFLLVGTLDQFVPVRSSNRTTDFNFSYTFTSDDAALGKVTFRADASLDTARDALTADNEAISSPVKIGKNGPTAAGIGRLSDDPPAAEVQASALALLAVAPNPARMGDLTIRLSLPDGEAATLEVLDVAGRSVMKRNLNRFVPGVHDMSVTFDRRAAGLENGMYFYRIEAAGSRMTGSIVLMDR